MRRLTPEDDRGSTTLFVVLMMPLLLVFSALVFDGGRGVLARRQTQNAADAGALAKAVDCAKGITTTSFTAYETNGAVLDTSKPTPACGSDNATTVWMKRNISFEFVPGGGNRDVRRSATAKWGGIGAADTLPLTLSECDFQRITAGGMPTGTQTVYFHSEPVNTTGLFPCNASSSGLNIPGGFGWISGSVTDGACIVHVTLSTPSDQGNSPPSTCNTEADWDPLLGHDWLIAVYGATNGHNYTITGFAEFTFEGYKWNGGLSGGTLDGRRCPDPVTGANMANSVTCLQGRFKQVVTHGPGGGFDFDATTVWLDS